MLLDKRLESVLVGTAHHVCLLAALEDDEGGHGLDAEFLRNIALVVNVDLYEDHLACVLLSELLVVGLDHLARGAPLGSEVDYDGNIPGSGNNLLEMLRAGDLNGCVS